MKKLLLFPILTIAAISLISCEQKSETEKAAEEVGDAVEEVGDSVAESVEEVKEAAEDN